MKHLRSRGSCTVLLHTPLIAPSFDCFIIGGRLRCRKQTHGAWQCGGLGGSRLQAIEQITNQGKSLLWRPLMDNLQNGIVIERCHSHLKGLALGQAFSLADHLFCRSSGPPWLSLSRSHGRRAGPVLASRPAYQNCRREDRLG